jgi:hypothetical protein
MDKAGLLDTIREAHRPIENAVAGLDDSALLAPAPGMDGWTRKDVVAHIEWWHDHSARVIEALLAGNEPYPRAGPFDLDALNARILEQNRERSAADVRSGEASSFVRLIEGVEAASEEELFQVGRYAWLGADAALRHTVEADSSEHYPDHLPHLQG